MLLLTRGRGHSRGGRGDGRWRRPCGRGQAEDAMSGQRTLLNFAVEHDGGGLVAGNSYFRGLGCAEEWQRHLRHRLPGRIKKGVGMCSSPVVAVADLGGKRAVTREGRSGGAMVSCGEGTEREKD